MMASPMSLYRRLETAPRRVRRPVVMGTLSPMLIAVGLFVPLLPFAVLAWIEPDLPADDQP